MSVSSVASGKSQDAQKLAPKRGAPLPVVLRPVLAARRRCRLATPRLTRQCCPGQSLKLLRRPMTVARERLFLLNAVTSQLFLP